MSTVKTFKTEVGGGREVVAAFFKIPGEEVLAVKNKNNKEYYAVGYETRYTLSQLQEKDGYKPIYEGESVTLEF